MKHEKRTRAENIAGKSNNQTQTEAEITEREAAFFRQCQVVSGMLRRGIKKAEAIDKDLLQEFLRLMVQVSRLILLAGGMPMKDPLPAELAGTKINAEMDAHMELEDACTQAADLLSVLASDLGEYMGATNAFPGGGAGVLGLADNAGKRLMECFAAASEENLRNGGAR